MRSAVPSCPWCPALRGLLLLVVILSFRPFQALGQAPTWQTLAAAAADPGSFVQSNSYARALATDGTGNVYLAGTFSGSIDFGSTNLVTGGPTDVRLFVAKWNRATNRFVWAVQAGGTNGGERAAALAVRGSDLYVAGSFYGTVRFGSTTLTSAGAQDLFVAKLTDAGTTSSWTWAQRAGGRAWDEATALAVSGANVYVAGGFGANDVSFPAQFGATTLAGTGSYSVFVAKLTDAGASGSWTWAVGAGALNGDEEAHALAVSGASVYIAGQMQNTTAFGNTVLTASGSASRDLFVAKLTDLGGGVDWVWAQKAGSVGGEAQANALAVNGPNVYVGGSFGNFNGNPFTLGGVIVANAGRFNAVVAKLVDGGASSSWTWAQAVPGTVYNKVNALAVSGNRVYAAGSYGGTGRFGPTTLTATGPNGYPDLFVAQLTDAEPTGAFAWAVGAGGAYVDTVYGMALSGPSLYVAGASYAPAQFGALALPTPVALYYDTAFLASLSGGTLATAGAASRAALLLFPNPARASVTIQGAERGGSVRVQVVDLLGREVRSYAGAATAAGGYACDLRGVPAGLYLVRVSANGGVSTHRLQVD